MQTNGNEIPGLLDSITAAVFVFSENRIFYTNAAAQALTQYSGDQLAQMRMADLIHPDFRANFAHCASGTTLNLEVQFLTADGRTPWADTTRVPIRFDGHDVCLVTAVEITRFKQIDETLRADEERYRIIAELSSDYGMVKDITERSQAEKTLRQSEHHFRLLAENSPDYIYIFDLETRQVVYFNKPEFLGYSVEELSRSASIINALHPQDGISAIQHGQRLIMHRVSDAGAIDYRILHKDGHWEWVQFRSGVFAHDNTGKPTQLLVTLSIVTERKHLEEMTLERERLHVALEKEQELNELKTKMMARISHEFRTPLSTILISTQLLERYGERFPEEKRQKNFQQIKNQVNHVTRILDDIALIVRGGVDYQDFQATTFDLEQLSRETVARLQSAMQTDHTFTFEFSEASHHVTADQTLTQIILYHLLSNAIKYSDWGTTVRLEAGVENGEVILRVHDQGVGILPHEQPRIFEAFYRGSNFDERPGLGLGLAIVKIAVELQGGKVLFTSLPKQGTTFVVHLPIATDSVF